MAFCRFMGQTESPTAVPAENAKKIKRSQRIQKAAIFTPGCFLSSTLDSQSATPS